MNQPHNPARWMESDLLAPDVRNALSEYGAEAPHVAQRARMLASLEQQLGLGETPSAEAPGAQGAQPALGGASGAGVGTATAAIFKLKLVVAALATIGASLALFAGWNAVRAPRPAALATAPSAHAAGELVTAPSFRVVPPEFTRWAPELSRLEPEQLADESAARVTVELAPRTAAPLAVLAAAEPPARVRRARKVTPVPAQALPVEPSGPAETSASEETASEDPALENNVRVGGATGALAELTLLAHARRALLAQPERSLELTDQHAREFPDGTLCEEREVLAIESLLKLGLDQRAKQRALLFEQRFPHSAHRAHLARLIALPAR